MLLICTVRSGRGIDALIEKVGYDVFYTISAGILPISAVQDRSSENILKLSEFALAGAKEAGKNTYVIYKEEDYQKFLDKKELIHTMRKSVNQNFEGFEAYFQPIIDIKSQKLVSAETLLRFRTKERGFPGRIYSSVRREWTDHSGGALRSASGTEGMRTDPEIYSGFPHISQCILYSGAEK